MKSLSVNRLFALSAVVLMLAIVGIGSVENSVFNVPTQAQAFIDNLKSSADAAMDAQPAPLKNAEAAVGNNAVSGQDIKNVVAWAIGVMNAHYADAVSDVQWNAVAQYAHQVRAGLSPSDIPIALINVGGLVVVAAICEAATAGACTIALIAIGIALIIIDTICSTAAYFGSNFFGYCQAPSNSQVAINTGKLIIQDAAVLGANLLAVSTTNLLNALNGTQTALAYEAASASLTQLPNSTFNQPQALAQSGVAQQLASEVWALSIEQATIEANVAHNFNYYESQANAGTFFCPVNIEYFPASVPAAGPSTNNYCPQNTVLPTSADLAFGTIFPAVALSLHNAQSGSVNFGTAAYGCYAMWIQNTSSWSGVITAPDKLVLVPDSLNASSPWTNITPVHSSGTYVENMTFTVPSGGYYICTSSSSNTDTVFLSFTFPLNTNAMGQMDTAPSQVYDNPVGAAQSIGVSGQALQINQGAQQYFLLTDSLGHCEQGQFDLYGGNTNASIFGQVTCFAHSPHPAGAEVNFVTYLDALESNAMAQAQVYWSFLHFSLGYDSVSEVPLRCVIPSPAQLLPPNVPITALQSMNVSSLLQWYQAQLRALATSFNLNDTLNSTTICNVHPKWNNGNSSVGFGVYAYGYVFAPGVGVKNSNGSASQFFANPKSWNISGAFYMAPTVANYTAIPLNVTFSLGDVNAVTFFISPFLKNIGNNSVVNATGPTTCFAPKLKGCYQSALNSYVTGLAFGNSTAGQGLTGSVYPLHVSGPSSVAIFLTACFVAQPGATMANATFHTTSTCTFGIQRLNATGGTTCVGNILYSNGIPIGTCGGAPGCIICPTGAGGACAIFFVSSFTAALSIFGTIGQDIGCIIGYAILIALFIVVGYAIFYVYRGVSGRSRTSRRMEG